MITALAALLALSAGFTIGFRTRPFTPPAPGCPCRDDAAFIAHERARFDDLVAQLDITSDLDHGDSPFGWFDSPERKDDAA